MPTTMELHRRLARLSARWALLAVLATGALATGAVTIAPSAQAQDYPARPVRIMVGFAPGSSADITAAR